jgi:hypothetical protein
LEEALNLSSDRILNDDELQEVPGIRYYYLQEFVCIVYRIYYY